MIVIIFAMLLFAGCGTSGNARVADHATINRVVIGTTSSTDLLVWFGQPTIRTRTFKDGVATEVWLYSYATVRTSPMAFVPFVGMAIAMATDTLLTTEGASLVVGLDASGTVVSLTKGQSSGSLQHQDSTYSTQGADGVVLSEIQTHRSSTYFSGSEAPAAKPLSRDAHGR